MENKQITIPSLKGFILVLQAEISRCQANAGQTMIYMEDGNSYLSCQNLKVWEDKPGSDFIRVHDSHLISKHHISQYIGGKTRVALMKDTTCIPVARRRTKLILNAFKTAN